MADQDRSIAFYVDCLGFQLVQDTSFGSDQRWVQVAPPGAQTSLTLVTWIPDMVPGSLKGIVLETDDLDGDVERLRVLGVCSDEEIQVQPWGRFVTFDDPDGNGLILQSSSRG